MQELVKNFGITKQIFVTFFVCCGAFIYFSFYVIFGDKGILKYYELRKNLHEKDIVKNSLESKMQYRQNLVNGMNLKSLDLDLLDEQARKNLGYAGKNEVVIYNNPTSQLN
jgi:cell division protein FtsB